VLAWLPFLLIPSDSAGADWLADVIVLGERVSGRFAVLRPYAPSVLRWVDRRVINGLRHHPLPTAPPIPFPCAAGLHD
jgi:hypothetical protein